MEIDPNSWHYRVYQRWEERRKRWDWPAPPKTLDLCRYCRIIFLFAPWRWFIQGYNTRPWHDLVKPWVVVAFTTVLGVFGWLLVRYTSATLTYTAIAVVSIAGAVALIVFLAYFIGEWRVPQRAGSATWEATVTGVETVGRSLVWNWLKAKKRKVCPILTVKEPNTKEEA